MPLIDADQAEITVDALLARAVEHSSLPLDIAELRAGGPLAKIFHAGLKARGIPRVVHKCFARAAFRPADDADTYLTRALRKKRRKELGRQWRRLSELGRLEYRRLARAERPDQWIAEFLDLERRGWKGSNGTAIACIPHHRRYFEQLCREMHGRGSLDMSGLFLDGRAIALKCNFIGSTAPAAGFAFKIAYDEAYDAWSPGVQLEIEHIKSMHSSDAPMSWMDSCAAAEHFMINRLWTERLELESILAAPPTLAGRSIIATIEHVATLHRRYGRRNACEMGD